VRGARGAIGARGEAAAVAYLSSHGYEILATNLRTPYGELDALCRKEGVLIAVEVKTRRTRAFGLPEEAVTRAKLAHIAAALAHYRQTNEVADAIEQRIDVVAIDLAATDQPREIRLIEAVE